jgi:triosephosphate isomerase
MEAAKRRCFVGGNWKCNKTLPEAKKLLEEVVDKL